MTQGSSCLATLGLGPQPRWPLGLTGASETNKPTGVELMFVFTILACSGTISSELAIAKTR